MLMKVNVSPAPFDKLNIRHYNSGLSCKDIEELIDLCGYAKGNPNKPGFQCPIFDEDSNNILKEFDQPVVKRLKQSFVNACQTYWNIIGDHKVTGWIYVSWTDMEKDLSSQGKETEIYPFWHSHTSNHDCYRLSGVLYLSLPDGAETTKFSNNPDLSKNDFFNLPFIKNEWFIFPSMMPHLPGGPGKTNKIRICVAADYWIE